jgi:hypothetical protein
MVVKWIKLVIFEERHKSKELMFGISDLLLWAFYEAFLGF